ncbi:unnamed protein product, partial [marine sediment metagenome]
MSKNTIRFSRESSDNAAWATRREREYAEAFEAVTGIKYGVGGEVVRGLGGAVHVVRSDHRVTAAQLRKIESLLPPTTTGAHGRKG